MRKGKNGLAHEKENVVIHVIFILMSICTVLPFLLLVGISLSNEKDVVLFGYRLIPLKIDFSAYQYIAKNSITIMKAYGFTIFYSIAGTAMSLAAMILFAYPLSIRNYKYRRFWSLYLFFTMIFSGGTAACYIVNVSFLHMKDTVWIYLLPGMINAYHVILLRTYFQSLPVEIYEAAKLDGASIIKILLRIVIPLSKPAIATVALFGVLGRWNDWMTPMLYIQKNNDLLTIQFILQQILKKLETLQQMQQVGISVQVKDIPSETVRMALAVIATLPALVIFPLFQKYFAKGLVVGSVKG